MHPEERQLLKKISVVDTERFDFKKSYNKWLHEFFVTFNKPAPKELKRLIVQTKNLWEKDELPLFRILADDWIKNKYTCPKCNKAEGFVPARYRKVEKMVRTQKVVRVEKPRTLSCSNCSYTFSPLAITAYRKLRLDLRTYVFYQFISHDGKYDFPAKSVAEILGISEATAKKIKLFSSEGRSFTEAELEKYMANKDDNTPIVKVMGQLYDFKHPETL